MHIVSHSHVRPVYPEIKLSTADSPKTDSNWCIYECHKALAWTPSVVVFV
jgi:hypothetical protein